MLAIFGALAVYVIFSSKKKPDEQKKDEQSENTDKAQTNAEQAGEPETSENDGDVIDTVSDKQEPSDK